MVRHPAQQTILIPELLVKWLQSYEEVVRGSHVLLEHSEQRRLDPSLIWDPIRCRTGQAQTTLMKSRTRVRTASTVKSSKRVQIPRVIRDQAHAGLIGT